MFPPYDAGYPDPSGKRPCEWHYWFKERDDGCWTFEANVVPGSAGPDVECGPCEWELVYCEKEADGNDVGNDYMSLTLSDYYKTGELKGLCGNFDGNPDNDNTDEVCSDAMNYNDGVTITDKCIDGEHQGNG